MIEDLSCLRFIKVWLLSLVTFSVVLFMTCSSIFRVRDFEFTGELCVFDLLGIMLYHGWVVDPSSEAAAIIKHLSYNQLTNNIFAWREEAIKNNNNDLLVKGIDSVVDMFFY